MLKIKTYSLDQAEKANDFMETNKPRMTGPKPDIFVINDRIVIIYDDNKTPINNAVQRISNLLQEEKDKLVNNQIVLRMSEEGLKRFAPQGFLFTWSDTELKAAIQKANPTLKHNEVKMIMDRIASYGNSALTMKFTIEEVEYNIKTYMQILEEENAKVAPTKTKKQNV